jgi:ABC-2 type transport system ATP-binding protein
MTATPPASVANAHVAARPTADLHGLNLAYGKKPVLKGLDWQLHPGQVIGLLGRNGAGKTTLLEAMLGLRDLQGGTVELFGEPGPHLSDAARARIGYVPQRSDLFEGFTANELLAYFRSFYPRWNTAKVDGLLSRWDIARDQPIARLSGGQQQRLSIIRALAHEPDLLVLDEPVSSLDPAGRREFLRELVDQVLDRGTTVVLSTHILSDLERVAFNVAFLRDGRIAVQAPLDELLDTTRQVTGTREQVDAFCVRHHAQVLQRRALGDDQELALLTLPPGRAVNADGLPLQAVNLEELFMELA